MAQIDSLSANEFEVHLDGERVPGVFRVSGFVPFKLAKMVQRDPALPFNRWIQETLGAKEDIIRPVRSLVVVALDDGIETRRWTVSRAWISEISYSDFNTSSGELVEEVVTLHYEDIQETWAGGELATS